MSRNVVLGVCGSVAAYRSADLARELMRHGYTVRVCLTDAAQHFVTKALFEALTGEPCLESVFEEPTTGRMAHIDWARWADVVIVAPATANTLAKLANGIGDDMFTTLALATHAPLVVAPAMNPAMYTHDATQTALRTLRSRAASLVEPLEGDVACGEHGQGKLASIEAMVSAVESVTVRSQLLKGKHVVITSGPTAEPIDAVRLLTNRSSGKMGAALARAVLLLGGKVTVVTGPTSTPLPMEASVIRVKTALDMLAVMERLAPEADVIVGAAAVADYRVETRIDGKLRRSEESLHLHLIPNPDVIAAAVKLARPGTISIGFAAEPSEDVQVARDKLTRKGLTALAMNDISRSDVGFESDNNELNLLKADGSRSSSGIQSKLACAVWLFENVIGDQNASTLADVVPRDELEVVVPPRP